MIVTFLVIWYVTFSLVTFCLMGMDKYKAKHNKWRIPELTLIAFSYFGGFIGIAAGMYLFHHKTRKWYFYLNFIFALFLHSLLLYTLYTNGLLL